MNIFYNISYFRQMVYKLEQKKKKYCSKLETLNY